jgi:hypothetical protein
MADPLTIIGTTAAVIDLAKIAWKILDTAYKCYQSESGTLEEDESLEKITTAMNDALGKLSSPQVKSGSLTPLISRCQAIGEEILGILGKTKGGKDRSFRTSIKVSLAKFWNQEKVERLRTELDHIMVQLGVHLQLITR